MEYLISVSLFHFGMDVETRKSKLKNFLCKELNSFDWIAENDALIDLKFSEKSVQAVKFFFFFEVRVILGQTFKG